MTLNTPYSNIINSQVSQASFNVELATHLIIQKATELVNNLIEKRGHDKPPFLPEEYATHRGINKIVKEDLGETSAVLLRFLEGYIIKVNQKHHPLRQHFSCAHEIGHILFNDLKLEQYISNFECRTFNPQAQARTYLRYKERLCEAAATELLMPESIFGKYLANLGTSTESIKNLSTIFKTSIPATAIRIAEVSTEPCIAILWKPHKKNKSYSLKLDWCIGPGRNLHSYQHYIPKQPYEREKSKLYKAYRNDDIISSIKHFKKNNNDYRIPMESKGFGHGENRYVISLAFPER